VIGGLMILAWALDLNLFEQPQTQIYLGVLFILVGFGASNGLQKRWTIMAAWLLLAVADFILLAWVSLYTQILGFLVGGIGLVLLLVEFLRRFQQQRSSQHKTSPK
jgi:membrane protein implicated in regulation of membrane protease activity